MNQPSLFVSPPRLVIFDCDGVVLDSNDVKSRAFHDVALRYGGGIAQAFVAYHKRNGGISRYLKFQYLFDHILGRSAGDGEIDELLQAYADRVLAGLMACAVAPGLPELKSRMGGAPWMIASGGDEQELRRVFSERGLDRFFDAGIFGSPRSKSAILEQEVGSRGGYGEILFLGDSRYDHEVASQHGLDFVFVHGWSEFEGWPDYCAGHGIPAIESVGDLMHRQ